MRIKELTVRNFRKIRELTIAFPPGLTVIVGQNNSGKTAIMDALRLMLFPGRDYDALRINEDDFRQKSDNAPIEISCVFCDLNLTDEARLVECLVKIGDGKFEARLNVRVEFNSVSGRPNFKWWGGETEGGTFPSNLYDNISCVYLQPLRDPDSGLRPGQNSQISRLIRRLTSEAKEQEFVDIAKEANEQIGKLKPVDAARNAIDRQMQSIAGKELMQKTKLVFNDPTFARIISGIQPEIAGLPFSLNGLGYNNLVFTAATLGTLRQNVQFSYRSVLIEEPEAHLHPHLQVLLLRYLSSVAGETAGNQVQVIASSHSPILASQCPVDAIVGVHETEAQGVTSVSVCKLEFDEIKKKKLRRYLDATRGELFFARRILMVEGIAEALLLPLLAKAIGRDLKESAVTVINADGINFDAFLPLFGNNALKIPVAILTDGDAAQIGAEMSDAAKALKAKEGEIANLRVRTSEITFEHELARNPPLLALMLDALTVLHPQIGAEVRNGLGAIAGNDAKAGFFYEEVFKKRDTSKGRFAQELAELIETKPISANDVPVYIREALQFLG